MQKKLVKSEKNWLDDIIIFGFEIIFFRGETMDREDQQGKAKVIVVGVQKGGVGKTTTTVNLAYCLAKQGMKILVIDLDPQSNASMLLGKVHPEEQPKNARNIFIKNSFACNCIVESNYKNLDLIAASINLFEIPNLLGNSPVGMLALKNSLDEETLHKYDAILIDTPPYLGGLFITAALIAANAYIMPVECESFFSLNGVDQFQEFVQKIKSSINPDLKFLGALITMYDSRTKASSIMIPRIIEYIGSENTFDTIIPRNSTLNRAALRGKVICHADTRAPSCRAYRDLAEEITPYILS